MSDAGWTREPPKERESAYQRMYYASNREVISLKRMAAYRARKRALIQSCATCAAELQASRALTLYCSGKCKRAAEAKSRYARKVYVCITHVCTICGRTFTSNLKKHFACAGECVRRARIVRCNRRAQARRRSDIAYAIKAACRNRINELLRSNGVRKTGPSIDLIGCSIPELIAHLEGQFRDGMDWTNRGLRGWHIDHIVPCRAFDFSDEAQRKTCFHYTNLRPLWWHENIGRPWPHPIAPPRDDVVKEDA